MLPTEPGRSQDAAASAPAGPPPGWYTDPSGALRWWDGATWGPAAPALAAVPNEVDAGKVLSVLSWLGMFVFSVFLPLIIYLIEKDTNRFTRWHAAEAFNLQVTFLLLWNLVLFPLFIVAAFSTSDSSGPPLAFLVLFPGAFLLFLAAAALSVYGAVRAGQGVWWKCPVAVPFIRAHRRDGRPV